jgi:hypothetical protein
MDIHATTHMQVHAGLCARQLHVMYSKCRAGSRIGTVPLGAFPHPCVVFSSFLSLHARPFALLPVYVSVHEASPARRVFHHMRETLTMIHAWTQHPSQMLCTMHDIFCTVHSAR